MGVVICLGGWLLYVWVDGGCYKLGWIVVTICLGEWGLLYVWVDGGCYKLGWIVVTICLGGWGLL